MTAPVLYEVTPKSITVTWSELTSTAANGGDLPIFYLLQWWDYEAGTPAWTSLTTDGVTGLVLNFTHVRATVFSPTVQ